MKAESNVKPNKFEIENVQNDRCDVIINTNIVEETEDENVKYTFDMYRMNICYNQNIAHEIENDFEKYLKLAQNYEYKILAAEIRKKRDELLKESDQDMCIDRMGLEVPTGTTFTSWLNFFKKLGNAITDGKIAKYRKALRDIPQQEGFPYNVIWPNKEDLK